MLGRECWTREGWLSPCDEEYRVCERSKGTLEGGALVEQGAARAQRLDAFVQLTERCGKRLRSRGRGVRLFARGQLRCDHFRR
jgi:hypothetical protein